MFPVWPLTWPETVLISCLNSNAPGSFAFLRQPLQASVSLVFDNDFDLKEQTLHVYMAFAFANTHLPCDAEVLTAPHRGGACDVTVVTVNNSPGQQKHLYLLFDEMRFSANSFPKRSLLPPCSKGRDI